jgi:hypothetical protein
VDEETLDQRHAGRLLIADCGFQIADCIAAGNFRRRFAFLPRNQLLPMVFETWKGMFKT